MLARALIVLVPLSLVACDRQQAEPAEPQAAEQPASKPDPHAALPNVSVDQLSKWLANGEAVPVDANNGKTRTKIGVIPKSVLLTKSSGYDGGELP